MLIYVGLVIQLYYLLLIDVILCVTCYIFRFAHMTADLLFIFSVCLLTVYVLSNRIITILLLELFNHPTVAYFI